jgi:hypothetical protein
MPYTLVVICSLTNADDGYLYRQSFDCFSRREEYGGENKSQFTVTYAGEGNVSPPIALGSSCRSCDPVKPEAVYRLVSFTWPKLALALMIRLNEIKAMADRLRSVRDKLFDVIANKLKTPGSWLHIKRATGMYW